MDENGKSHDGAFLSVGEIAELLKDYANPDFSVQQLELKYRVHSSRIYAELQKAGMEVRSPNPSFKDGLDEGSIEKFIKAYADNETIDKIAEQLGLNYDQIYVLIRENGLQPRHADRRNVDNPEFRSTLAALYADTTLGVSEVAARMGIGVKTLSRYVIKFDLPRRGKGGGKRGRS